MLILLLFAVAFTIAVLGVFVFSVVRLKKSKAPVYKVFAILTGAYLFCVFAFFAWRIGDVALSPKAIPSGEGTLVFEGRRYVSDSYDEYPYGEDLKKVGLVAYSSDSKALDFIGDLLFPTRLYIQSNDAEKNVLWERGLMLEAKYKKAD